MVLDIGHCFSLTAINDFSSCFKCLTCDMSHPTSYFAQTQLKKKNPFIYLWQICSNLWKGEKSYGSFRGI